MTAAQERFATQMHATSIGNGADQMICMYSEQKDRTLRWIVNQYGRPIQYTEFCTQVSHTR